MLLTDRNFNTAFFDPSGGGERRRHRRIPVIILAIITNHGSPGQWRRVRALKSYRGWD